MSTFEKPVTGPLNGIEENIANLTKTIKYCLNNSSPDPLPALILIYAEIDIMSHIAKKGDEGVKQKDFEAWVSKYILPEKRFNCSAKDLYSARCAVVHTYGSESGLSKKGKARELFYAWRGASKDSLQKDINRNKEYRDRAIAIKLEDLLIALEVGVAKFFVEIDGASEADILNIKNRAKKIFRNIPHYTPKPGFKGLFNFSEYH